MLVLIAMALAGPQEQEAFAPLAAKSLSGEPVTVPVSGHYTVVEAIRSVDW